MAQNISPYQSPTLLESRLANNRSPSPPQPQSKRDKRRTMLSEKLQEMTNSFHANHYEHYYAQLSAIQCDINLVLRADPYSDGPLDDSAEGIAKLVEDAKQEICRNRPISGEGEGSFGALAGKNYAKYVNDINTAIEFRDRDLTMCYNQYQEGLDELRRTNQYKTQLAHEEHQLLSKTLRERLIQGVNQKRSKLLRDKEQLDIADSNALLLNPNQFSLGNPSSPGGAQSNRKTRHTRHRPGDNEELNNAVVAEGNKRKRKGAFEDTDNGSPAPSGRAIETSASAPYRDAKAKLVHSQYEAPLYSIERLFTEKELAMNMNRAHVQTSDFFTRLRAQGPNGTSSHMQNAAAGGNAELNNGEGDGAVIGVSSALDAANAEAEADATGGPATTSPSLTSVLPHTTTQQTAHTTRAAHRAHPQSNPLTDLANTATALPAFPSAGIGTATTTASSKANAAAPPPAGLSEAEVQNDLAFMMRPVGDVLLARLTDECCERKGPVEGARFWTELRNNAAGSNANTENGASSMVNSAGAVEVGAAATAPAMMRQGAMSWMGGIPMSKTSSMGGTSEAGGTAMMRSASAADYGSRSRARA